MFSLIITIISIALVAALAVASVYYGGSAFQQGTAKASASTLVAQAQQISAAAVLYSNDHSGAVADSIQVDLVDEGYLSSIPVPSDDYVNGAWSLAADGRTVTIALDATATQIADKIDEQAGFDGVTRPATISAATTTFGVLDAAGVLSFFYKG